MIHSAQIDAWREDTPGTAHRIHLNNAGAALMPNPVLNAIQDHLELEALTGGYEAAAAQRKQIARFFDAIARMLNASANQIAYAASATDAYNRALSSVKFEPGDRLLTTTDDYVSNQLAFLQLQKRFGVQILRAPNAPEGGVDLEAMESMIRLHAPVLVSVTHVPTNSGLVQPVEAIGEMCRANGILYLVDACQSAGQLPLDVQKIHCDFLSATFRKFLRGPRGAGFLYVSDRVLQSGLEPLFVDLHSAGWVAPDEFHPMEDARRFELWERPYALLLGGKAAAEYAMNVGLSVIETRIRDLVRYSRMKLGSIPGVRLLDRGPQLCGIITLAFEQREALPLKTRLDQRHINTSLVFKESALIDFKEKDVDWALRISPHYYNTEKEIDQLAAALEEILGSHTDAR